MKGNESGTDEKKGLLWIHSSCLFCNLVSFHKLFFYKKGDHSVESFYELLTKPWSKKFLHPKIRDFQGQIKSRKKWNLVIELFFPDSMRLFLHSEGFIMKMWQYLVSLEKKSKMEKYVRSQQMHCASGLRHLWVNQFNICSKYVPNQVFGGMNA